MSDNLVVETMRYLDDYREEVRQTAREATRESAELTVRILRSNSPKKARKGGKYARGWQCKRVDDGVLTSMVVYNGKFPGLTHLLENGHASKNQYGVWGRVRAIKHIAPAAEAGIQRLDLAIRARLR